MNLQPTFRPIPAAPVRRPGQSVTCLSAIGTISLPQCKPATPPKRDCGASAARHLRLRSQSAGEPRDDHASGRVRTPRDAEVRAQAGGCENRLVRTWAPSAPAGLGAGGSEEQLGPGLFVVWRCAVCCDWFADIARETCITARSSDIHWTRCAAPRPGWYPRLRRCQTRARRMRRTPAICCTKQTPI